MFGLSVDALRRINKVFSKFPKIQKVILYGSRAKGNYKKGSDIDVTLIGKGLTLKNSVYPLMEELEELYLPYKFDISIFNQLKESSLIGHILRIGKTFYRKESNVTKVWEVVPLTQCLQRIKVPRKIPRKQFKKSGTFPIVSQEQEFINGYWSNEADVIYVESPLIIFGDHTQILKYVDFDFVVGADGVKLLQPKAFLYPKYFYYFLVGHPVDSLGYARHFRSLKELEIVFPKSLSEQRRIVAILDEALTAIAAATTNTEKNLANARELFESSLNYIFENRRPVDDLGNGATEKWPTNQLAEACLIFTDGDWIEKKDQSPSGIRLIQTGNLGVGSFNNLPERARYISKSTFDRLKCTEIFDGYCLVSRLPDPIGRSCIIPDAGERMITAVDCTIIRFKAETILPDFFKYYSQSRKYLASVDMYCTGATRRRISRKNLGKVLIPIPSFQEQSRIVAFLDKLLAEQKSLIDAYETKINTLSELKQSLLRMAFTGELTADLKIVNHRLSEASL